MQKPHKNAILHFVLGFSITLTLFLTTQMSWPVQLMLLNSSQYSIK